MSGEVAYLDTSAFVKTVVAEAESGPLRRFLKSWPTRTSSALIKVEALRAVRLHGNAATQRTRRGLRTLVLISVDDEILDSAAALEEELRSLDAIHLASMQAIGDSLGVVITYDRRMAVGARSLGFDVASPR